MGNIVGYKTGLVTHPRQADIECLLCRQPLSAAHSEEDPVDRTALEAVGRGRVGQFHTTRAEAVG